MIAVFILHYLPSNSISAQWADGPSQPRARGPELYASKSATKAFLIGLGPGLLVHGWGHFYVGDKKTGGWLLASECVSAASFYYLAMLGVGAMDDTVAKNKIENAMTIVAAVFFVGWAYDFLDAPNKVLDARRELQVRPSLSIVPDRQAMNVGLTFAF